MQSFLDSVVALIIKTSTDLPPDVRAAMRHAVETEESSSRAGQALNIISQNIDQAESIEGAAVERDTTGCLIQGETARRFYHLEPGPSAAQKRSQSRYEFFCSKWLGDVVIGTSVETIDPFHPRPTCR